MEINGLLLLMLVPTIIMGALEYNKTNKKADLLKICYERYNDVDRCKKDVEELMK